MLKYSLRFISILVFISGFSYAQTIPAIEWQQCLGGTSWENATCIQQTMDGGYIVAGFAQSRDGDITKPLGTILNYDCWVAKLSSKGLIQWEKSIGGFNEDKANAIQQTRDGGYIIAGYTYSNDINIVGNHGSSDFLVVKLSAAGNIEWQKCYGGTYSDEARSVQQTFDGGYIVAGSVNSSNGDVTDSRGNTDGWVLKISAAGAKEWKRNLGGSEPDGINCVRQTSDGGFIVGGWTMSDNGDVTGHKGYTDVWVVKLGIAGNMEWQKCFGGTDADYVNAISQTMDGGYIVAATSASIDGDHTDNHNLGNDFWIIKLDVNGNIAWKKSLGGTNEDLPESIQQDVDKGYIATGYTWSNNGDVAGNHGAFDVWVVKLDTAGNLKWQKSLGGTSADKGKSISRTIDGGYVIAGLSSSKNGDVTDNRGVEDYWIVKLSPDHPTFTFTGTGNFGDSANWANGIPPSIVPAGTQIIINPSPGGQCILDVPLTISYGASLTIAPNAVFIIQQSLTIEQ